MNHAPNSETGKIVPLLRIGLEDDEGSSAQTQDPTIRVNIPFHPRETASPRRGWDPPDVTQLQQMLPQYHVESFIARGGMGAVYKGLQEALQRPVAIKILPPEVLQGGKDQRFSERFKHEARAMARLSHPGIVAVFDAGETADGLLYFVMEYVEGTDLAQLIAGEGPLEIQRTIEIIGAVCEALHFAHQEGIVHRDIKPSNIMIDNRGRVKIADFGLAKSLNVEGTLLTGTNVAMGTPDYIAPETMIPGMGVDHRADLYAVGVMLYQMLTGRIPRGRFLLPSGIVPHVDHRFDAIVDKAMQTDREKRYDSAVEMKTDLSAVIRDSAHAGGASPGSPHVRPEKFPPAQAPRSGGQAAKKLPPDQAAATTRSGLGRTPLLFGAAALVATGAFLALKKPAVQNAGLASPSAVSAENEKWARIWDESSDIKEQRKFFVNDGWLLSKPGTSRGMTMFYPKIWRDCAIRCEWKWAEGTGGSHISLRQWEASRYQLMRSKSGIRLAYSNGNGNDKILKEYPVSEPKIGDVFTLELRAVGTTLIGRLDGREVIRFEDDRLSAGGPAIYLHGNAEARNIEALNLDPPGFSPATPSPPRNN
ncbi:protein kinase domain-containing protein [Prosthecobacter sp.]|uniref:serine/threonine protein kinase n=1 Tax=Prosthecobacter sp. TaxID=1965333 RepID=UPI0037832A3D